MSHMNKQGMYTYFWPVDALTKFVDLQMSLLGIVEMTTSWHLRAALIYMYVYTYVRYVLWCVCGRGGEGVCTSDIDVVVYSM